MSGPTPSDGALYLLDTNAISDLMKNPTGPIARQIAEVGPAQVITSVIVACEVEYGVLKRGSQRLAERAAQLFEVLDVRPLDPSVATHYAAIRHELERLGTPIGANDLLIAAHALALGATVITRNTREFQRVPGLVVEDWEASI